MTGRKKVCSMSLILFFISSFAEEACLRDAGNFKYFFSSPLKIDSRLELCVLKEN